jgi:Na+-driven multidrug efflux pump
MSFVDTAMVGRLGPASLGGVGIGNGILFAFMVFGLGCVLGIEPLVSQALGAGLTAVGVALILRFAVLSSRPIRRV